jgi:hypothetical protein
VVPLDFETVYFTLHIMQCEVERWRVQVGNCVSRTKGQLHSPTPRSAPLAPADSAIPSGEPATPSYRECRASFGLCENNLQQASEAFLGTVHLQYER